MKKLLLGLLATFAILGGVFFFSRGTTAEAGDCDNNAIIRCGVSSQGDLVNNHYNKNDPSDLKAIYDHYGISAGMIRGKAVMGTVYKNGEVRVGNEVVATGAYSVGRQYMAGSTTVTIAGKKFYQRKTSVSFASDSIKAIVFLDEYGKFQAAILTACGNPVVAAPKPKPIYKCTAFKATATTKRDEFMFDADAFVRDATFKYVTYTVKKDGKVVGTPIKVTNLNPYKYVQANAGAYTVEAVITVDALGKTVSTPVGNCKGSFTVKPAPSYACTSFDVTPAGANKFTFTAKATAANGATFKSIVYTVKDAQGKVVAATPAQTSLNPYTYTQTKAGTYAVSTNISFNVNGQTVNVADAKCVGTFTIKPTPKYECKALTALQSGSRTEFVVVPTLILENVKLKTITYTAYNADGTVDGKPFVSTTTDAVSYIQDKEGTYKLKAVAVVDVDGKEATAPGNCETTVTVQPKPQTPTYKCVDLKATLVADQKNTYAYTLSYQADGGAKLTKVSVNYGDNAVEDIALNKVNNFTHLYAKAGNYTTTATLTFSVDGTEQNVRTVTCSAPVTVAPEKCVVPGKGDVDADDESCKPCKYDENLPADSKDCKKPEEEKPAQLVNTGTGDVIGMFAAITVAAGVAHRFVWGRRFNS